MTVLTKGARAACGVGLVALLAVGLRDGLQWDTPLAVTSSTTVSELAAALATTRNSDGARELVYRDTLAPSTAVSALLAGAATRGDRVTVVSPGTLPGLSVTAPADPVAMRRASLTITLRGTAGTTFPVVIDDASGAADTFAVLIGPSGTTASTVAVEPTRAGRNRWRVRAAGASETVYAWTLPEAAVRALVLSGPPTWESRFLARALESAGVVVSVHQSLGREQSVTTEGIAVPRTLAELEAYDVVVIAGAAGALPEDIMRRWVDEGGGGLLLVGASLSSPGLKDWSTAGPTTPTQASNLQWSGFAELVPLPEAPLAPNAAPLSQPHPGVPIAWTGASPDAPDQVYAAAGWMGRGRIFASGLESWPWAMEAGLGAEHAAYWESVVEWLAGGLREDGSLTAATGAPYVAWTGRLRYAEGSVPEVLELSRPVENDESEPRVENDGSEARVENDRSEPRIETLRLLRLPDGSAYARFVPVASGDHPLASDSKRGAVVTSGAERPSWVQATLQIGGAGAEIRSGSSGTAAPTARPLAPARWQRWLTFLGLAGLALTGWVARRVEGLR